MRFYEHSKLQRGRVCRCVGYGINMEVHQIVNAALQLDHMNSPQAKARHRHNTMKNPNLLYSTSKCSSVKRGSISFISWSTDILTAYSVGDALGIVHDRLWSNYLHLKVQMWQAYSLPTQSASVSFPALTPLPLSGVGNNKADLQRNAQQR